MKPSIIFADSSQAGEELLIIEADLGEGKKWLMVKQVGPHRLLIVASGRWKWSLCVLRLVKKIWR